MSLQAAAKRRTTAQLELNRANTKLRLAILNAHRDGMTPTQISEEANVSRQTVHTILRQSGNNAD